MNSEVEEPTRPPTYQELRQDLAAGFEADARSEDVKIGAFLVSLCLIPEWTTDAFLSYAGWRKSRHNETEVDNYFQRCREVGIIQGDRLDLGEIFDSNPLRGYVALVLEVLRFKGEVEKKSSDTWLNHIAGDPVREAPRNETVEDFIARGGTIKKLPYFPPPRDSEGLVAAGAMALQTNNFTGKS